MAQQYMEALHQRDALGTKPTNSVILNLFQNLQTYYGNKTEILIRQLTDRMTCKVAKPPVKKKDVQKRTPLRGKEISKLFGWQNKKPGLDIYESKLIYRIDRFLCCQQSVFHKHC